MLTSILPPVVDRDDARKLWLRLAALHSLGMVASATAVGGTLALLGWALGLRGERYLPWVCAAGAGLALAYLPRQLGWTRFPPLLQSCRQVPRRWAYEHPRWATALLFGLGLGSGCYTRVVVPTFYLLFVWSLASPGPVWPLVVWGSYGLARSSHVWWLACTAPKDDVITRAHHMNLTLFRRANWMHRLNAVVLAVSAVWLVVCGIPR
jgi:hypothetical protein